MNKLDSVREYVYILPALSVENSRLLLAVVTSNEHSSDCGSVATEFLKISELYRHNCACGSDW